MSDLLHLDSYDSFSSLISEAVGTDPSATQLALFFRLTQDIVASEAAKGVVGWAKRYYRQRLARWVVKQNGLVSNGNYRCVEIWPYDGILKLWRLYD